MKTAKDKNLLHFTQGTPARLVLQVMGLTMLTYSVTALVSATETIAMIKGTLFFVGGCIIFLLREHVSNGDYFKEFAKYAEDNLVFTVPEPEEIDNDPEGYQ